MVELLLIPLMAYLTGYFTLKAYTLGLKHNYEIRHDIEPTEIVNPVRKFFDNKKDEKAEEEQFNLIDEWINGAKEE